jgi:putative addiction module component (TIGR02574 family)
MGSQILERLRSQALDLPEADRAELAHDLVTSLDGPPDANASREWEEEILRRLDEVEAGTAKVIDREEFTRRLRERISQL